MYNAKRQVNRKSFDWYGLSQRFSIRKYHFGAASVLLGTALILGLPQASAKADDDAFANTANTAQTSTGQGVDEGTNSATDGLKNVTLPPTASTTEEVDPKHSKRSRRALPDGETTDYSGVKISGKLTDSKTDYAVGEQILGSYNLDVSTPSKIEDGGYILITASNNEPIESFEIGSSLKVEKVNNNQYKLYTSELAGGLTLILMLVIN